MSPLINRHTKGPLLISSLRPSSSFFYDYYELLMKLLVLPAALEGGYHQDGAQHGGHERHHDEHRHPGILAAQFCVCIERERNKSIK